MSTTKQNTTKSCAYFIGLPVYLNTKKLAIVTLHGHTLFTLTTFGTILYVSKWVKCLQSVTPPKLLKTFFEPMPTYFIWTTENWFQWNLNQNTISLLNKVRFEMSSVKLGSFCLSLIVLIMASFSRIRSPASGKYVAQVIFFAQGYVLPQANENCMKCIFIEADSLLFGRFILRTWWHNYGHWMTLSLFKR